MLIFTLLAIGCLATPSEDPQVVFDAVWTDFDELYGGFHQRDIDWDAAYEEWAPTVGPDSTDEELYEALTGLLTTLDDGHVRLTAPGREVFESNHTYRDGLMAGTFDEAVVETYLTDVDTGDWDWYLRGQVAPDVHYVWFPGIDDNTWVLNTMLDAEPKALIIDLRHSHGGAFTYPMQAMGRLVPEEVEMCSTRSRNGPGRDDYSDWFTWNQAPAGPTYEGPLYVLVDGETISASERILLVLQQHPNTTLIGVTSNGAFATSIGREAPNGWYIQLPVQEVLGPQGALVEGIGVEVDIELLNDPADVEAGQDEVLELAIAMATGVGV